MSDDKLKDFLESEEGRKALKDASDKADKTVKKLRDEMRVNPEDLNKPMTI